MAQPTNAVPPPRREPRRFAIPTPADLRHPRQGATSPAQVAEPDPALAQDSDAQPVIEQRGDLRTSANQPKPTREVGAQHSDLSPDVQPDQSARLQSAPDQAGRPGGRDRDVAPTPATLPRPAAPEPRPAPEPIPSPAGPATRRIFPNPATLMASGRGGRKVRSGGLRGRRLPKVEETSAGGVVLDLSRQPPTVALIARHDRRSRLLWSLPKGHVEPGETAEEAALREVLEETGLVGRIVAPLGVIDFWFVVEDRRIHKTVHHFVIEAIGGELSDEDLEVEAVEWIPFDQVIRKLAYGDERRLVEKAAQIVPGLR